MGSTPKGPSLFGFGSGRSAQRFRLSTAHQSGLAEPVRPRGVPSRDVDGYRYPKFYPNLNLHRTGLPDAKQIRFAEPDIWI